MNSLEEFITTISKLRGPDGCPWDREQTHQTLGRYLLEESYEVLEAIHEDDSKKLKEELGDLFLQIALHAQIAKDNKEFDIFDVANGINQKMISRHPHVFGDKKISSASKVVQQWETLKDQEKKNNNKSSVERVSKTLPALLQALKVSEAAVGKGFEWKCEQDVFEKLVSELNELQDAISDRAINEDPERDDQLKEEVELELGDVFFCMVNLARWQKVSPEESLIKAIEKFKKRFTIMEGLSDKPLNDLTKDEMAGLWVEAKEKLSNSAK